MKTYLLIAAFAGVVATAHAQGFDSGSNGSLGALNLVDSNLVVDLPPDGRLHYTTIHVGPNRTLSFRRNALNTPVYLLAQGDITIDGTVDVSGAQAPGTPPIGGVGGPGGFDGGKPGFGDEIPPGDGYGPGAGGAGTGGSGAESAGGAGYGSAGAGASSNFKGIAYGSPLLIPLIGGSGGGGDTGQPGSGGGGGGGAILVCSSTRIVVAGTVAATGGPWRGTSHNAGSGGGIRVLAPKVEGRGTLNVSAGGSGGGVGRIRVDTLDKTTLQLGFNPLSSTTVGANMFVNPGAIPRLDILEAAGQVIPLGAGSTVRVQLPFGSSTNRTVRIQARDFGTDVPIRLTLTPDSGRRIEIDASIANTTTNPAEITIPVGLPANTLVTIHAWTR